MMHISPKEIKTANLDLATIFNKKITAVKQLSFMDMLSREIVLPNNDKIYLDDKTEQSLNRLITTVQKYLSCKDIVEYSDICKACKIVIGNLYIEENPSVAIDFFLSRVEENLKREINTYKFYANLYGLNLQGFDTISIGDITIQNPDYDILKRTSSDALNIEDQWEKMKDYPWINSEITGSHSFAENSFFQRVKIACGLLALSYTTISEWGAVNVRIVPSIKGRNKPSSANWFSFPIDTKILITSTSIKGFLPLTIKKESADGLMESSWFTFIANIIQKNETNELEFAMRRAVYWFFDAQSDTSLEMKFIKFWSCIECFFSFEKNNVTKSITQGVVTLLCIGRFAFHQLEDWKKLKKEIEILYDLRCGAVHDAQYNHISEKNVADVSKWAAWIVLEVSTLIKNGYVDRAAIKKETNRIYARLR